MSDGATQHSPTHSLGRLAAVDGLRALAMLMVFTYHVWEFGDSPKLRLGPLSFGRLINTFPSGVDMFMVLSGFCLFWPLVSRAGALGRWSTRDYARRRVRRIVPPYYAAIAFVVALPFAMKLLYRLIGQHVHPQPWPGIAQIATHLTFTHTLFRSTWDGLQGAFWSLGLEAQFYIVFPLVVYGYRRWGIRVAGLLVALSVVYRVIVALIVRQQPWQVPFLFSIIFLGRWMQFAAGMLAANFVAHQARGGRHISSGAGLGIVAVAVVLYGMAFSSPVLNLAAWLPLRDLLLAAAYGVGIVTLCNSPSIVSRLFAHPLMSGLGFISYSVFLIHQNLVYYFGELLKRVLHLSSDLRFALLMTAGFGVVLALAVPFFWIFERPFVSNKPRKLTPVVERPQQMKIGDEAVLA